MKLESYEHFKSLGDFFKYVRKSYNVTMTDLAKNSGVSQPYLSLIENNKNIPSDIVISKISNGITKITEQQEDEKELEDILYQARNHFNQENVKKLILAANKDSDYKRQLYLAEKTVNLNHVLNYFSMKEKVKENIKKREQGEFIDPGADLAGYSIKLDEKELTEDEIRSLETMVLGIREKRNQRK
ncbi:helix-turn-helix domain-containing protein [Atopococcus tabaci]|uniref:helix-turn-helix domain-containing protein n=1 Tax=Atopococcus tabaci TaxID=269774 RepID=UPI0004811F58|nr:helix-turn-helix transcriptional regulator [Atopococcus tabaci]